MERYPVVIIDENENWTCHVSLKNCPELHAKNELKSKVKKKLFPKSD